MVYVLFMTSSNVSEVWSWFQKIAPDSYFDGLVEEHQLGFRKRIYSLAVVVWLMIQQRLQRGSSLAAAVHALVQGGAFGLHRSQWGRQVRRKAISVATGGYCQARQKVPTLVATQVADHIFEQLRMHVQ